jgi:ribosomal protein S18 acetylase RimI-like enzyme
MLDSSLFQIRSATPEDAQALAELGRRTFHETFAADNDPADLEAYLSDAFRGSRQEAELQDPSIYTLICETADGPAAYAQVRQDRRPDCVEGARPVELWRFYVGAEWHGRGIAHSLMQTVLERAISLDGDTLWLGVWEGNARAIAFYRKYGFEKVGAQKFLLGTDRQTDWVMARRLR